MRIFAKPRPPKNKYGDLLQILKSLLWRTNSSQNNQNLFSSTDWICIFLTIKQNSFGLSGPRRSMFAVAPTLIYQRAGRNVNNGKASEICLKNDGTEKRGGFGQRKLMRGMETHEHRQDIVNQILNFLHPLTATSTKFWSKVFSATIGRYSIYNHIFVSF